MSENFGLGQDLESMNDLQRQQYVKNLCNHLGIPENLNLVALTYLDDQNGPSRLVPYVKRGGAEAIRTKFGVNVNSLTDKMINGSIMFTATGIDKNGRQEVAIGSKYIDRLTGTELDDAVMTASTRALRRLSLQFTGTGILDESEINQRRTIHVASVSVQPTAQPTVQPSSEPGRDVTPEPEVSKIDTTVLFDKMELETEKKFISGFVNELVSTKQEIDRQRAIEQLNQQAEEPKVKKTRKKRSNIDLGPSEIPAVASTVVVIPEPVISTSNEQVLIPVTIPAPAAAPVPEAPPAHIQKKSKLTADQVKPFRQRLFRLRNDYLEGAGLAPKEGMSISGQMRALAQFMFADIADMNDLDEKQWDKYLSTLENKVQSEGPAAAVKYIEETLGL